MSSLTTTATTSAALDTQSHKPFSLYEICSQLVELDETDPAFESALNSLGDKVDNYHYVQSFLQSEVDRLKAERDHFSFMIKAQEKAIDKIKERALLALETLGVSSIKSPNGFSISRRPSYSVVVDNLTALPDIYKHQEVVISPDKTQIKLALQSGEKVPGARLVTNESVIISKPRGK